MGALGRSLPKALMPIAPDATPLSRLIQQVRVLPHERVIVSTASHWSGQISAYVNRNFCSNDDEGGICVEANPGHHRGPVAALRWIVTKHPADDYFILLSDVVFLENRFEIFRHGVERQSILTATLEQGRGGIVEHQHGFALRFFYEARKCPFRREFSYSNWSGAACLPRSALLSRRHEQSPVLEDILTSALDESMALRCIDGPQFVNLNFPSDLRWCRSLNLV